MILQTCLLLTLSVAWEVSAASYSNVFVHTGSEAAPAVEYYGGYPYNYEYASPKAAQYKEPIAYEYPFGSGSYSYRTATALAEPVATIAAPPSSSVVYPAYTPAFTNLYGGRSEPNGYEIAYMYAPSTGAELRQLNEGEVYRGGFSYLQPDLVQYVTDNNHGLNAIFKNYLSGGEVKSSETAHHETPHHESAHHAAPCHEGKSAALIDPGSHHEHTEEEPEERHGGHEHHDAHETPSEHESHPTEHEGRHAEHEGHPAEHEAHEDHEARHGGHNADPHEHEIHEDKPHHEHNIIIKIQESHDPENDEPTVEIEHQVHDHSEGHDEPKEEETPSHDSDEHAHTHESIVEEPPSGQEHASQGTTIALAPEYPVAGNNVFISYNDVIKCIQAALASGNSHPYYAPPVPKPVSPLTYLIYNKPC